MGFHTQKLYLSKTNGQIGRNHSQQLYHQILNKTFQILMLLIYRQGKQKYDWEHSQY